MMGLTELVHLPLHRAALMAGVDKTPALVSRVISGGRLNVARSLTKLLGRPNPVAPPQPASEPGLQGRA